MVNNEERIEMSIIEILSILDKSIYNKILLKEHLKEYIKEGF